MIRRYRKLDALAVLTDQDVRGTTSARSNGTARRRCGGSPTRCARSSRRSADLSTKRIFAAGRYTPQKGYDLLVARVGAGGGRKHPDWELKICGNGQSRTRLELRDDRGAGARPAA